MMIEVPGDLEAIRRFLLRLAPRLEQRQPGVTAQIQQADLRQPLRMAMPKGELLTVNLEERGDRSVIKVAIQPPMRPMGKLRAVWWRWWARRMLSWSLKGIRRSITKEQRPQA